LVFDQFREARLAGGEKSYWIFHPTDDPDNLFLIFQWDKLENAKKFMNSPKLKEAMQKAGVIESPEIRYLEEMETASTIPDYART